MKIIHSNLTRNKFDRRASKSSRGRIYKCRNPECGCKYRDTGYPTACPECGCKQVFRIGSKGKIYREHMKQGVKL